MVEFDLAAKLVEPSLVVTVSEERIAFVSDLHGNLEATEAVLEDIAREGIRTIINGGDLVGYGLSFDEVISLSRSFLVNILGNHEVNVLSPEYLAHADLKLAAKFTAHLTLHQLKTSERGEDQLGFLASLPFSAVVQYANRSIQLFHASPLPDVARFSSYTTCWPEGEHHGSMGVGHTHKPLVIIPDGYWQPASSSTRTLKLGKEPDLIINPGSVGQPRDGDPRASYAILSPYSITFRQVEYHVESTVQRYANLRKQLEQKEKWKPYLPVVDALANRLTLGQ